jgi:hypothetical protein
MLIACRTNGQESSRLAARLNYFRGNKRDARALARRATSLGEISVGHEFVDHETEESRYAWCE